jgi:hypothetical protein
VRVRQNGVQLTVPAWMLGDVFCAQLRCESEPLVAAPALIALRELLDAVDRCVDELVMDCHVASGGRIVIGVEQDAIDVSLSASSERRDCQTRRYEEYAKTAGDPAVHVRILRYGPAGLPRGRP